MIKKLVPLAFGGSLLLAIGYCWHILPHTQSIAFADATFESNQSEQQNIKEIEGIVKRQSDAWNRGDIAEFMVPYWHDDRLTFSSGGTTTRGWESTFQRYKKKYPDQATMGKLTFGELESQMLGTEAVLMLGTWKLERTEPVEGNFSLVWKRIDNRWVIVHDHSSLKAK